MGSVALQFFSLTLGNEAADHVFAALLALSSLGNIVVQTFTAARGKDPLAV